MLGEMQMKKLSEHNAEEMKKLDSADVQCECGGEMKYVADKKTRSAPGRVAETVICEKCNGTHTKYVFVK